MENKQVIEERQRGLLYLQKLAESHPKISLRETLEIIEVSNPNLPFVEMESKQDIQAEKMLTDKEIDDAMFSIRGDKTAITHWLTGDARLRAIVKAQYDKSYQA